MSELTPEQHKKYISREESIQALAQFMNAFSTVKLRVGQEVFRKNTFVCDFQTTATVEFTGPITLEALDGVLAYVSYLKPLLETAIERYGVEEPVTGGQLRDEMLKLVGKP
jgi:hypothetical protein